MNSGQGLRFFLFGFLVVLNSRYTMSGISDFICLFEGNTTVITSPGFPVNYSANYFGEWKLFSTAGGFLLNFTSFYIEEGFDFVYIYSGVNTTVANYKKTLDGRIDIAYNIYVLEFPYLILEFISDYSIQESGFRVEITAINVTSHDVCERRLITVSERCNFHLFCISGLDEEDCADLVIGQRLEISSSTFPYVFHKDELYLYREWRFAYSGGYQLNLTLINYDYWSGYLDIETSTNPRESLYTNRFNWHSDNTRFAYAYDTAFLRMILKFPNSHERLESGNIYYPLPEFHADILITNVTSIIDCSKVCSSPLLTDPRGEIGQNSTEDLDLGIYFNCICEWNITVGDPYFIKLNITFINIPCDVAPLEIFSSGKSISSGSTGSVCGNDPRLIISDGNTLLLKLQVSTEATGYGFRAFYEEIDTPGCGILPSNRHSFVNLTTCKTSSAFIASVNYPQIEHGINAYWRITTSPSSYIEIHFLDFNLQSETFYCEEDYLEFHMESSTVRLCNMNFENNSLPFLSDKNELTIELNINGYYWQSKFLAFYNERNFTSSVKSIVIPPNLTCMDLPHGERQHCYCLFIDQKNISWIEASIACKHCGDGAYLATIRSQRDMDFLQQLILQEGEPLKSAYIGLIWDHEKERHKWIDGDPLSFASWRVSRNFENRQPDSGGDEKCSMITLWSYRETNNWQDIPCGEPLTSQFICNVPYALAGPYPPIEFSGVENDKESCGDNQYRCLSGECILSMFVCDNIPDCFDQSDELNCSLKQDQNCSAQQFTCKDGTCIHSTFYCDFIYHCKDSSDESGCVYPMCTVNEFRCESGRCIPRMKVCDMQSDCDDGSDERDCAVFKNGFGCFSGRIIPERRMCDGYRDCTGKAWEDEPKECYYFDELFGCNATTQLTCKSGVCAKLSTRCIFEYDVYGFSKGCRDATHLSQCENFECPPNHFKCRNSYCIPERYRCNNEVDCPYGEDEEYCDTFNCARGSYKCHGSFNRTCLPQSQVCDGIRHCTEGEDERYCDFTCPNGCDCVGLSFNCSNAYWRQDIADQLPMQLKQLFLTDVKRDENDHGRNSSDSPEVTIHDAVLRHLNDFPFLLSLDVSGSNVQIIRDGDFEETKNLQYLYLNRNNITIINEGSFHGLDKLKHLDLSGNPLTMIGERPFKPLKSLEILSITATNIPSDRDHIFSGLEKLRTLYSDKFYFCCLEFSPSPDECYPKAGQFSGCHNLMRNSFLRMNLWLLGIAAVFGNGFVLIFRICRRDIFPNRDQNPAQAILIFNLAIADFLIGIYMLIIAGADLKFQNVYYRFSELWQTSSLCKFAGFLSVVGSEASVMFLTVITVDRFQGVVFPFSRKKLRFKSTLLVAGCVWTLAIIISGLPLIPFPYFGESYYGRSSVCLALPLTTEYRPGWLYSIFVFLVFNFLSFSAMLVCYVIIYIKASNSLRFRSNVKSMSDRQVQIAMRMFFLVFTDMACWMPVIIMGMLSQSRVVTISGEVYAWTAVLILPVNSALNPFLYTFFIKATRRKSRHSQSVVSHGRYSHSFQTTITDRRPPSQDHVNPAYNGEDLNTDFMSDLISDFRRNHLIVTLMIPTVNKRLLTSLMKEEEFSLSRKEKENIKLDVMKGLNYLHDNYIIHGRISPEYVIIDKSPDEEVRAFLLFTPLTTEMEGNNNDESFGVLKKKDLQDLEKMFDVL